MISVLALCGSSHGWSRFVSFMRNCNQRCRAFLRAEGAVETPELLPVGQKCGQPQDPEPALVLK